MKCHVTDYEDEDGPHSCTQPKDHNWMHTCGCGYKWRDDDTTQCKGFV